MKIDFVSDVVCPWCAIGLNALEQAIQRLDGELSVELHVQPFELNPQMPPEGEEIVAHLTRKYGITPEDCARNAETIRQRGESVGGQGHGVPRNQSERFSSSQPSSRRAAARASTGRSR